MSDYPGAIQMLNTNCFVGRNGVKPRYVILHGTAGGTSAEAIAQYFKNTESTNNPVSSHYVIGQDGTIVQAVNEKDGAFCNGVLTTGHDPWWSESINPNLQTISIEHVKPDSANATSLTVAQQAASFGLIRNICQRNGIPMRPADANGGITGHYSIDPVNRARCPGPYNWDALWAFLKGNQPEEIVTIDLTNSTVASHFTGGNDIWQCKDNGFIVGHAILTFYRQFGGKDLCGLTYLGLPKSNETPVPNRPGVVYQRFERGVLVYDPAHTIDNPPESSSVYLLHIDSGLGMDPRIEQLATQNAALQNQIATLQGENAAIKALLAASNLGQIGTLSKQISDDIALIMKLSQVQ